MRYETHNSAAALRVAIPVGQGSLGELAEVALAHVAGDQTERAYHRGDALDKRRALMEAWASFCEPKATISIADRLRG